MGALEGMTVSDWLLVQEIAVYNVAAIKVDVHAARGMGFTL